MNAAPPLTYKLSKLAICALFLGVVACGDKADRDGDGEVSADERAARIPDDVILPLRAGQWNRQVDFTEIKVKGLSDSNKKSLMEKMSKRASRPVCLTQKQAEKPPADFFGGGVKNACKYRKFVADGERLDIMLSCTMDGMALADMKLSGNVSAEKMTMELQTDLRLPMIGTVALTGHSVSNYAGPCPQN